MKTSQCSSLLLKSHREICRRFVGKDQQVKMALTAFFAGLHLLIEDRPGVGKTTLARCLCRVLDLDLGRIQFTPDLLPGDITGMNIWDREKGEFRLTRGPVFHSFLLADELNRAAARTQSALLEAMQEKQVTLDGVTHKLEEPFFVVATQNPSQYAGTFALPEAQLDRFGISFSLDWPEPEWEEKILGMYQLEDPSEGLTPSLNRQELIDLCESVRKVSLRPELSSWIVELGHKTRTSGKLQNGFSTRGLQHLLAAAQCLALWNERDFVIPEDVIEAAPYVARHKVQVTPEMKIDGHQSDSIILQILEGLAVPA